MLGGFLAEHIPRAHRGPAWHGASLAENLAGLTAAQAPARPIPEAHSIWEIVLHLAGWAGEVARRLEGGTPALPAGGDWPAVGEPTEAAWSAALEQLDAAHAVLAEAVRRFPESRWNDQLGTADAPLGTGVSYAAMIAGLLQHDAYHGGQIGLLRRAVNPGAPVRP